MELITGQVRDRLADGAATGLDYFGARYMSSAQGRFTSPDPLLGSAHLDDPQLWNRYSYGANNPLRYNDPAGLWNWDVTAGGAYTDDELTQRGKDKSLTRRERNEAKNALKFRTNFRAARNAAEAAANASGDASSQQSVAAWGTENDGNNVSVGWSNQQGSAARVQLLGGSDNILASFNLNLKGNELAGNLSSESGAATMNFRMGEVGTHELGHGQGFESDMAILNFVKDLGGTRLERGNLMGEGQGTPIGQSNLIQARIGRRKRYGK